MDTFIQILNFATALILMFLVASRWGRKPKAILDETIKTLGPERAEQVDPEIILEQVCRARNVTVISTYTLAAIVVVCLTILGTQAVSLRGAKVNASDSPAVNRSASLPDTTPNHEPLAGSTITGSVGIMVVNDPAQPAQDRRSMTAVQASDNSHGPSVPATTQAITQAP